MVFLHEKQEQIFSKYLIVNTFVSTKQMVFSKKALGDHLKTPCFFFFFLLTTSHPEEFCAGQMFKAGAQVKAAHP